MLICYWVHCLADQIVLTSNVNVFKCRSNILAFIPDFCVWKFCREMFSCCCHFATKTVGVCIRMRCMCARVLCVCESVCAHSKHMCYYSNVMQVRSCSFLATSMAFPVYAFRCFDDVFRVFAVYFRWIYWNIAVIVRVCAFATLTHWNRVSVYLSDMFSFNPNTNIWCDIGM